MRRKLTEHELAEALAAWCNYRTGRLAALSLNLTEGAIGVRLQRLEETHGLMLDRDHGWRRTHNINAHGKRWLNANHWFCSVDGVWLYFENV